MSKLNLKRRICVIGAGYWGKNHIRTLYKLNSLAGIVELDKKTLKATSKAYPHIKCHLEVKEALSQNYDGFIIATPAKTHCNIAKLIISEGKPVLIEKPMALTISEAKDLVKLSKKNSVNVMVGHLLLFHPAIKKIKKLIDSGEIGELQYIYSNRLNLGKVRTEENVFWSFAPHDIAIFLYLTGSSICKTYAKGSAILQQGIPDSTLTHFQFKNGTEGHTFVSWLHPFKEHRLVVIGSKAMISFEDSLNDKPLKLFSKKINLINGIPEKVDGPVKVIEYEKVMPLEAQLDYFINNLSRKKVDVSNVEHGFEVVKVLIEASEQII